MSLRGSTASPTDCSGDMYSGVPRMVPARVVSESSVPFDAGWLDELREAEVEELHEVALAVALDEEDVLGLRDPGG